MRSEPWQDTEPGVADAGAGLPQYSLVRVLAVWAAAALPMGLMAWVVAPRLAPPEVDHAAFARTLLMGLTAGLVWQGLLVLALVRRERGNLRWATLCDALWLRPPADARGRRGGVLWLCCLPFLLGFGLSESVPSLPHADWRDFPVFMQSTEGQDFLHGDPVAPAVIVLLLFFNTVAGEELLFRGLLLPRMQGAFGRWAWLANGLLFSAYHLHMPWAMPAVVLDALWLAYPVQRWRSAWLGILVHSSASLVLLWMVWGP